MAMRNIVLNVKLFRNQADDKRSRKSLLWFLEALMQHNVIFLREHPGTPRLYQSGVRYRIETTTEHWQDIPTIIERRSGDCEDLSCWRAAELRASGINAHPYLKWRQSDGRKIYHAVVKLPDGRIEDPSLTLGMHGKVYATPQFI